MSSEDPNVWTWAAMEPELSETEKALRDLFVTEYLVDYDALCAAQRCGFQHAFAKDYATRFLNESYVQKRIKALEHTPVNESEMDDYDKRTVRAVLRREMQNPFTTGSARVAAASTMAKILKMDKPTPLPDDEGGARGGVLVVPGIANVDDWQKVAMESQRKLREDVRN